MYYEEKVMNGILCYRTDPKKDEWKPFNLAEMTKKYEALRFAAFEIAHDVEEYLENKSFTDDPLGLLQMDVDAVKRELK